MSNNAKITYKNNIYTKRNGKWVDTRNFLVNDALQIELNHIYACSIDISSLSPKECISQGDEFKHNGSFNAALRFYEAAIKVADFQSMEYILPRMTSCYRKVGSPEKAIEVLSYAKSKYDKEIISPALLTSAAAAYCDMHDYENALKCCHRAYALSNGFPSADLLLVYKRIDKESAAKV